MQNGPHKFHLPVGSSSVLEVGVPTHLLKSLMEAFFKDLASEVASNDLTPLPIIEQKMARKLKGSLLR